MPTKKTYYDHLKDPRWQRKRLEVLDEHDFTCEDCGESDQPLHVHHGYYEKGLLPWEYPIDTLHCLCEPCHKAMQQQLTEMHRIIGTLTFPDMQEVCGYLRAMSALNSDENVGIVVDDYAMAIGVGRAFHLTANQVIASTTAGVVDKHTLWNLSPLYGKHPKRRHTA